MRTAAERRVSFVERAEALCRELGFDFLRRRRNMAVWPEHDPGTPARVQTPQLTVIYLEGVKEGMRLHAPDCQCGRVACVQKAR